MEINSNHSTYGAAFRQKPIFFMSGKETVAFFEGKLKKNMTLQEDSCTLGSNDTYRRQHTTYEVSDKKKGSTFLDLDFLIKDETSSLKGNLSDKKDVDFYNFSIPFNRTIQNYFGVQIYMDMPEGCDYDLTLYDEYGNQVGKAEWDGEGRKTLTIPNWDTNTNKYCIKIENKNGEEVSPHDYYKISFKVTENKEQEKTDAIREAFGNLHGAYSRKDENWRECLDKYNEVLMDTEKNYTKEMEKLHQKQFESLPEEKQCKGGRTVDELLQDMAEGKTLDDAETEYVKIFANLKDFEKAQQKAELKHDFSEDFVKDLESKGISRDELDGMQIKIESNGNVTVSGIEDEVYETTGYDARNATYRNGTFIAEDGTDLLALFKEKSKNGAGYELYSNRWLEYAKNGWKKENDLVLKIGFDSSGLYDIGQERGYGATQNMWMKGISQSIFEASV